jgi:hypothetical protein
MRDFAARLSNTRLTRLCLVALALGCFAVQRAEAGCGDHVVVLSSLSPEERTFFVRMLIRGGCSGSLETDLAALPRCASCPLNPSGEGPCRGPYCSNERLPEGVPVSPSPTHAIDPWTLLIRTIQLQHLTRAGAVEPVATSNPIDRVDSIFHPPRAA